MRLRLLVFLVLALWCLPAAASPPPVPTLETSAAAGRKDAEEDSAPMTDEERERAAEEDRKRKERMARIIVLRWKDSDTDYADEGVRRNVRSRIDRPDALFFPETDLYQNGRKLKDKTVVPAMQPALVPSTNIPTIMAAVQEVAGLPYNAMQPYQWGLKAQELAALVEGLWFVDRVELREPLFQLYVQIGKAAENQNNPAPPFFDQIGNQAVNYYWYLAAVMAQQEPALMSKVTDQEILGTISYYLEQLQSGAYPTIKVDFELDDHWDPEVFAKTYEILMNGLPVEPDENAQVPVFLGRTDIYLRRKDTGHGLSERLEVTKLDDKFYPVMQNARKRMGIDFIDQLFLHPNECSPELDGDILNYLAIYARMHEKSEVYVAVPQNGNPNKVWIWRYDRKTAGLNLVGGSGDGFPVRFALVFSTGAMFNDATVSLDSDLSDENTLTPEELVDPDRANLDLLNTIIPFDFELRMHYNRLLVNLGAEFGYNAVEGTSGFVEYYQTPGHEDDAVTCEKAAGECEQVFNNRTFNRNIWLGTGVVLGRDAGLGFGPRIAARWGWVNMPHGWQVTLDPGWAFQPRILPSRERLRPLVDVAIRGGIAIPREKSLQLETGEGAVSPVFGLTAGVGFTF